MEVHVPHGWEAPGACVLWIHGGGWLFGSRHFLPDCWPEGLVFQALIDAGLAVASADYRHAKEAPFPAQLHDVKAAVRYLREFSDLFGINPSRIGAWGESAGGHLAALLGLTADRVELEGREGVSGQSSAIGAVVDFYGISDLETMPDLRASAGTEVVEAVKQSDVESIPDPVTALLKDSPLPEFTRAAVASPVNYVTADAPPFLLIHGELDWLVPFSQSVELLEKLRQAGAPAALFPVAGANHVFAGADPVPLISAAVEFLSSTL